MKTELTDLDWKKYNEEGKVFMPLILTEDRVKKKAEQYTPSTTLGTIEFAWNPEKYSNN